MESENIFKYSFLKEAVQIHLETNQRVEITSSIGGAYRAFVIAYNAAYIYDINGRLLETILV